MTWDFTKETSRTIKGRVSESTGGFQGTTMKASGTWGREVEEESSIVKWRTNFTTACLTGERSTEMAPSLTGMVCV
jgi:hypothetical protein